MFFHNKKYSKRSFSQSGEDLIVNFIFNSLKQKKLSYIDVGAHHPYLMNNTAYFYQLKNHGINIEPDPILYRNFPIERPRDVNFNLGINTFEGVSDFYIMSAPTMNTFSYANAQELENKHGIMIKEIIKIPVDTLPNIIKKYCGNIFPDFLSIDVEGLDLDILNSINYEQSAPKVICVETLTFSTTGQGKKNTDTVNFLVSKGYLLYADTYINSILVKKEFWER